MKANEPAPADVVTPPKAAKKPIVVSHHGVTLTDNYAWLRAEKHRFSGNSEMAHRQS